MTTTWHADVETLRLYSDGSLQDVRAYSLEAHLLGCDSCRRRLAPVVERGRLDRIWLEVADQADAPRPGVVERTLLRLGVRQHLARLLAATPSLRLSWFVAEAVALGFAVLATNVAAPGRRGADIALLTFLIVAALLPVAGVSAAYTPGLDPTHEIGLASPMRSFQLLLIRSAAVVGASTLIAGVAALALPSHDWTTAAWLLPSFGLTLASLVLATWVRPLAAAVGVAFAWVFLAAVAYGRADELIAFRVKGQLAFVLVIAVSAWVLARRRGVFDQGVMG